MTSPTTALLFESLASIFSLFLTKLSCATQKAQYQLRPLNIYLAFIRVFIKYCVFSKNSRKFATTPSPALSCHWLYKKLPANGTVHWHCVKSFEGLLQRCRRWRGCSELWKNTFFPEHPVPILKLSANICIVTQGVLNNYFIAFCFSTSPAHVYCWFLSITNIIRSITKGLTTCYWG